MGFKTHNQDLTLADSHNELLTVLTDRVFVPIAALQMWQHGRASHQDVEDEA